MRIHRTIPIDAALVLRELNLMEDVEEFSIEEAASRTGLNPGRVRFMMSRLMMRLATQNEMRLVVPNDGWGPYGGP